MKYKELKIIEQIVKEITDINSTKYTVVIQVSSTDRPIIIRDIPGSYLRNEDIKERLRRNIVNDGSIPTPFEIITITTVDPEGVEKPLEDLFPSDDGDEDPNIEPGDDEDTIIGNVVFVDRRILEYKEWLNDDTQTEFTRDRRTQPFDKERLKELRVMEDGSNAGALVDPRTGTAVGAIEGTTFAARINEYMQQNPNMPGMVGIVSIGGSSEGEEGEEGEEGADGLTAGQIGSAPGIAEEVRASIKGLGTSEGRLFAALKRIENKKHLEEVIRQYRELFDRSFGADIKNDFRWDPKNNENLVRELNDIMMPLGYKLEPISKDLGRQMTYRWIIWGA